MIHITKFIQKEDRKWKLAQLVMEVENVGIATELAKIMMEQLVRFAHGLVDAKKKHLLVINVMELVKSLQ